MRFERMRFLALFPKPAHEWRAISVRDQDAIGARPGDGRLQARPVRMIRHNEPAIEGASAASTANSHPARGHRGRNRAEPLHPWGAMRGRRGDDDGLSPVVTAGHVAGIKSRGQRDAAGAINPVHAFDRAVTEDRTGRGVEASHDPLRFSEWITEDHAALSALPIRFPPVIDRCRNLAFGLPAIYRQSESRLGYKGMAAHGFKGRTGGIGREFVISGYHPDFTAIFHPDLRRTEDMTGGMERYFHSADLPAFPIRQSFDPAIGAHAQSQDRFTRGGAQVGIGAGAGVIGMPVSNQRSCDGAPRIDVEAAGFAPQTVVVDAKQ